MLSLFCSGTVWDSFIRREQVLVLCSSLPNALPIIWRLRQLTCRVNTRKACKKSITEPCLAPRLYFRRPSLQKIQFHYAALFPSNDDFRGKSLEDLTS